MKKSLIISFFIVHALLVHSANHCSLDWINAHTPIKKGPIYNVTIVKVTDENIDFVQNVHQNTTKLSQILDNSKVDNVIHRYNRKTGEDLTYIIDDLTKAKNTSDSVEWQCFYIKNEELHVVWQKYDKEKHLFYIYDQSFDFGRMTLSNDRKCIAEISDKYEDSKSTKNLYVSVAVLKDDYMLLNHILVPDGWNLKYSYTLYDKKWNKIRDLNINNQIIKDKVFMTAVTSDVDGNVYEILKTNPDPRVENPDLKTYIVFYPVNRGEPIFKEIKLEGKTIQKEVLSVNNENQILITGLYSSNKNSCVTGTFSYLFKPSLDGLISATDVPFSTEFLLKGLTKKEQSKSSKLIDKNEPFEDFLYTLRKKSTCKDSSFVYVYEKSKLEMFNNSTAYSQGKRWTTVNFGDLIVLKYRQDGTLLWSQKIHRDFKVTDTECYLANAFVDTDSHDQILMLYTNLEDRVFHTYCTTVDAKGNESCSEVFNNTDIPGKLFPSMYYKCANGKYISVLSDEVGANLLNANKNSTLYFGELELY